MSQAAVLVQPSLQSEGALSISPEAFGPLLAAFSSLGFCGGPSPPEMLLHCQEECHLLRHKASVKQRLLSLIQEYFYVDK